ncbi:patatin-like phospholipase family protein [Petroclostridium sp. X23]|uniref:patatin-like phospholipase family protein n=1 Tax=Petroclostridium sp. X23 TaxID=3045146 RepID=UPI0024ACF564|nr:patatin-like phospholipase family protein [Petroclostridium sp. X23]WHH59878.1 patatin-like phospholipase family protein [Petroclostridium sp. X23]
MKQRKKIGLALGSGSSRGMAHIGVINVLKKYNIPIDYIAGSSIGAVVGAMHSAGVDLDYFTKLVANMPTQSVLDFSFSKNGLVAGNKIKEFLNLLLKNCNFEDLNIPCSVVCTDLIKCQRVILNQGNVADALRGSISIPGVFSPVKRDEMLLVDGGVTDRVPANIVRDMGADIIIASDVGFNGGNFKVNSFFDVIIRSLGIMEKEIVSSRIIYADVLIKPEVEDINPATFEWSEICVDRGREAAEKAVKEIIKLVV